MVAPHLRTRSLGRALLTTAASAALTGLALFALGCGAQSDTAYRGEPLAELRGVVQQSSSGASSSTPALDAALLFYQGRPGQNGGKLDTGRRTGTTVAVSGAFPTNFALRIYTPPPSAALVSCLDGQPNGPGLVGTAYVAAIPRGTPEATTLAVEYGRVDSFLVVYADSDLPAQSQCVVGALTKGYHLFHYDTTLLEPGCRNGDIPGTEPECTNWPYREVPMATELTLVLQNRETPQGGTATPPPGPSNPPADAGAR